MIYLKIVFYLILFFVLFFFDISQEYKRIKNKYCSDNETCTDENLFPLSGDTGKKIYVKLRHKGSKSVSKATDFDSLSMEFKDNLFEG